ncbi:MAG: type II toxin-antitoxin system HicA family toxin [Deltaproteobacteria bacterium]|nr:type II toxin-antitoxin system HicA family toxin [Deltaproteobacteria bacterium]MBW2719667.1 type II toxin-antitoxin system HicA family toxin [Deltaproteobacteria bacterium]
MKRKGLVKRLRALGWVLLREGSRHTVFTDGVRTISVPRHKEINENTAKAILKAARTGRT